MNAPDWGKIATAAAAFGVLIVAIWSDENLNPALASGLYTLACIFAGVWVTQIVIDWWMDRDHRDEGGL